MDHETARRTLEAEEFRLADTFDHLTSGITTDAARTGDGATPAGREPAEAGVLLVEHEVELAILGRLERDRREVSEAQVRIASGTYGRCEGCGELISDERLEAVPATRFCRGHEVAAEVHLEWLGARSKDVISPERRRRSSARRGTRDSEGQRRSIPEPVLSRSTGPGRSLFTETDRAGGTLASAAGRGSVAC